MSYSGYHCGGLTTLIQNAAIWENICFGRLFEEERYWKTVRDSCLELVDPWFCDLLH